MRLEDSTVLPPSGEPRIAIAAAAFVRSDDRTDGRRKLEGLSMSVDLLALVKTALVGELEKLHAQVREG